MKINQVVKTEVDRNLDSVKCLVFHTSNFIKPEWYV